MTATAFTLGKSQAVRIPARYRLQADEVEITERDGALILRPKPRTAADLFARVRPGGPGCTCLRWPRRNCSTAPTSRDTERKRAPRWIS